VERTPGYHICVANRTVGWPLTVTLGLEPSVSLALHGHRAPVAYMNNKSRHFTSAFSLNHDSAPLLTVTVGPTSVMVAPLPLRYRSRIVHDNHRARCTRSTMPPVRGVGAVTDHQRV